MTNEELVQSYQVGDEIALELLLDKNMGLIKHFSKRFEGLGRSASFTFEDLEQESYIAFIDAADRFECDEGIKFSTYVGNNIKWKLMRSINTQIPRVKKSDINSDVVQIVAMDTPISDTEDLTIESSLEDEAASLVFEELNVELDNEILRNDLMELLDSVFHEIKDTRTKWMIMQHYGLGGFLPKTTNEIAPMYKLSRSSVWDNIQKGLAKIRRSKAGRLFMSKYSERYLDELESKINQFSPEIALVQTERLEVARKKLK